MTQVHRCRPGLDSSRVPDSVGGVTLPPDQAARTRAWQCFDRSLDVRAGAGTGKTRVLVDRYLAWVLCEGWRRAGHSDAASVAGSVLAITFTEKAAGEMEERIGRSLRRFVGEPDSGLSETEQAHVDALRADFAAWFGVPEPVLIGRARALLAQAHRMEVSTIHAFAAAVLRRYPVEAGVHPGFQVDSDGALRGKAVRRAVIDTTRRLLAGPHAEAVARVLATLGQDGLEALFDALVGAHDDAALVAAPDAAPIGVLCRRLAGELDAVAPRVKGGPRGKLDRVILALAGAAEAIETHGHRLATDTQAALDEQGREAFDTLAEDLGGWPPDLVSKHLGEPDRVRHDLGLVHAYVAEARAVHPALFATVREHYGDAVAAVRRHLAATGQVSFDELLLAAERLLVTRPDVARALASRYGQLLIDEFQDTNPGQCRILGAIAAADPHVQRLFVVGDPKQSIYAFRQADLASYQGFVDALDEHLELTASFRSQAHLVEAVNGAFQRLFVPSRGLQPPPQALDATRPALSHLPAVRVLDTNSEDGKRLAEDAREVEAEAMARAVLALNAADPPAGKRWSRFAILSRVQSAAATTVEALERFGIPCVVSGDKEFYRRQEVLDGANLCRVLWDPTDAVAWVGLLRSPLGGIPDRALVPLARAGFFATEDPEAAARTAAEGDATHCEHLHRAADLCGVLAELRGRLLDGPVDGLAETILERVPIPDLHACGYLGERKAANLLVVIRGFCDAAEDGDTPLGEWLDEVAEHLSGATVESESALADETTDAVRVMSIHGSKGLQFEHVLVPRLDWRRPGGAGDGTEVADTGRGRVLRAGRWTTWGGLDLLASRAEVDAMEGVRLLYVACTRAIRSLALLGRRGARAAGPMLAHVERGFVEQGSAHVEVLRAETAFLEHSAMAPPPPPDARALCQAAPEWWAARRERWAAASRVPELTSASAEMAAAHDTDEDAASTLRREAAIDLGVRVHALLEAWDGGPIEATGDAGAIVAAFVASPLADRVRRARSVHRELPFVSAARPGAPAVGAIDLLIEEDQGWVVIDYKTNAVRSEAHAREVAEAYRPQAAVYVAAVKSALGLDRVGCELWFLRGPWAVELRS